MLISSGRSSDSTCMLTPPSSSSSAAAGVWAAADVAASGIVRSSFRLAQSILLQTTNTQRTVAGNRRTYFCSSSYTKEWLSRLTTYAGRRRSYGVAIVLAQLSRASKANDGGLKRRYWLSLLGGCFVFAIRTVVVITIRRPCMHCYNGESKLHGLCCCYHHKCHTTSSNRARRDGIESDGCTTCSSQAPTKLRRRKKRKKIAAASERSGALTGALKITSISCR